VRSIAGVAQRRAPSSSRTWWRAVWRHARRGLVLGLLTYLLAMGGHAVTSSLLLPAPTAHAAAR
jgi:hypothetical protein